MAAAVISLTNCQVKETGTDVPMQEFTVLAGTDFTKTTNSGVSTLWAEGDNLVVFNVSPEAPSLIYSDPIELTLSEGADTKYGKFTGTIPELSASVYHWYALYTGYTLERLNVATPSASSADDGSIYIGRSNGLLQEYYDDMSALDGSNCALYGVAKDVVATDTPAFHMKHLTSVIEFNVTNNTGAPIVVNKLTLDASEDVAGMYFVDITKDEPVYTPVDGKTITAPWVTVTKPEELANGGVAKIYMPVKPYTHKPVRAFTVNLEVTVDGKPGTVSVDLNPTGDKAVFSAGKIKKVTVPVTGVEIKPDATFIFNTDEGLAALGLEKPEASAGTDLVEGKAYTSVDGVSLSCSKGSAGTATRIWNSNGNTDLRAYNGSTFTITPPAGKYVTSISFDGSGLSMTADCGSFTSPEWTGKETAVTFSPSATIKVKTITVVCEDGAPVTYTLTADPQSLSFEAAGGSKNVIVTGSAAWSVDTSGLPSWLTVTESAAFSGVIVEAAENQAESERSASFAVYIPGSDARVTISVTQAAGEGAGVNTVSTTMEDYAKENSCTISVGNSATCYTDLDLNSSVRMSTSGKPNCGAFYGETGTQWRLNQKAGGDVIITVAEGCELKSVTFTFAVTSGGALLDVSGNALESDKAVTVSGTSATFTVGNSGDGDSGQVRITAVTVKYTGNGTLPPVPDKETTTTISMAGNLTVYIGETASLEASSNVEDATITYESEDTAIATVSSDGVVSGVAEGTVKVYARITGVAGKYTDAERYCNVTVSKKPDQTDGTWKATDFDSIKDGAQFVIVGTAAGKQYAMSNEKGTSAAPPAVAVTVSGDKLASAPATNLVWTMSKTSDGCIFLASADTWLYTTSSNNGLRVGKGEHNLFSLQTSTGYLTVSDGDATRFVGVYSSQDWRSYTSINANIRDESFAFYVKQ